MMFNRLKIGSEVKDEEFDAIYSSKLKKVSEFHFTPVEVAKVAARFLVKKPGARVLDVGSGAGKFCMVGAACTQGLFIGVEQRPSLFKTATLLAKHHQLHNTSFIRKNIVQIDFQQFDAIYFYNSFFENIFSKDPIDKSVKLDKALYAVYTEYVKEQLKQMPLGTRLATYFSLSDEVPDNYQIQDFGFDRKLKLWEKVA